MMEHLLLEFLKKCQALSCCLLSKNGVAVAKKVASMHAYTQEQQLIGYTKSCVQLTEPAHKYFEDKF